MAVIENILARAGYVKLSRYGMVLTPDGRIVDLHAMTRDVPFAAPVAGPTVPVAVMAAPPPPAPPVRVAPPVAPVATPVAPRSASMPSVIIAADVLPRLRIWSLVQPYRNLYLIGGVDDILNDRPPGVLGNTGRDFYFGGQLMFNDEDLKALLAVAGSALGGAGKWAVGRR